MADVPGLKPKDLCGIPWRVALALQADGWWLRSDIIWSKPNLMPESVQDRPTKSHEYLFLLTKSAKYYYDAEAIKEPGAYCERGVGWRGTNNKHTAIECSVPDESGKKSKRIRYMTSGKHSKTDPQAPGHRMVDSVKTALAFGTPHDSPFGASRNHRSVWTIATQPYKGAHFATFPEKLVEPCILAGSRVGDTVLDPFGGSGVAGVVAKKLGRKAILIDLKQEYCEMAIKRLPKQERLAI